MASLIGFHKNNKNPDFKGYSKLSINFVNRHLYVEPENEAFKMVSASFNCNFVMKKNLLMVFTEQMLLDFCLVFKNEQICQRTFEYIASQKKDVATFDDVSFDASFIQPIFQSISNNPAFNTDLAEIIATWHQLLDENEKEKYSSLMKEYNILDLIADDVINRKAKKKTVKNKHCKLILPVLKKEEISEIEVDSRESCTYSKIIRASQFQIMYSPKSHRRIIICFTSDKKKTFHEFRAKSKDDKFKCHKCEHAAIIDVTENGEICVKTKSKKHSCKASIKIPSNYQKVKIIRKPDYEIYENCCRVLRNVLVIFASEDKSLCYEFSWKTRSSSWMCLGCQKNPHKSGKSKIRIYYEGTEKEYVEILNDKHKCHPQIFKADKYRNYFNHVLEPNFEIQKYQHRGKESLRLIIFDAKDKSKYHQYFYSRERFLCFDCYKKRKFVWAKLCRNQESVDYVILSTAKHVCEPKAYVPKNILRENVDFKFMEETNGGKSKIFVFLKNDKTKCHVFSQKFLMYRCIGCNAADAARVKKKIRGAIGKPVTGHLIKNQETGSYTFQMKPNQNHICEPRPYQPELYEIIPKSNDFFFFHPMKLPSVLKVAIYSSNKKNFCFTFIYIRHRSVSLLQKF